MSLKIESTDTIDRGSAVSAHFALNREGGSVGPPEFTIALATTIPPPSRRFQNS
jgi:hypothetical protein